MVFIVYDYSQPSLLPTADYNETRDVEILHEVITKKNDRKKEELIRIVARLAAYQRMVLMHKYNVTYSTDLKRDIGSAFSGDLKEMLLLALTQIDDLEVQMIESAIASKKDEEIQNSFIDVILSKTNYQLSQFRNCYKEKKHIDLMDEVKAKLNHKGFLLEVLLSRLSESRTELDVKQLLSQNSRDVTDMKLVESDVGLLGDVILPKIAENCQQLAKMMTMRSTKHLAQVLEAFKARYQKSIYDVIAEKIRKEDKKALGESIQHEITQSLKCLANRAQYFAERLKYCTAGLGTKDTLLRQLILARAEIDLEDVKREYVQLYPKDTLRKDIAGDTSGDYKLMFDYIIGG